MLINVLRSQHHSLHLSAMPMINVTRTSISQFRKESTQIRMNQRHNFEQKIILIADLIPRNEIFQLINELLNVTEIVKDEDEFDETAFDAERKIISAKISQSES